MTTSSDLPLPFSFSIPAPLAALGAAASLAAAPLAAFAEQFAAAATAAAEREAARIVVGARSPHVALTARLLQADHPARAAVAALATAQHNDLPAALEFARSAALAAMKADDDARSMTALLTAGELVASIAPQTTWIRRSPISPRAPAPARLA